MAQPFGYGKQILQPIQAFLGPDTPVAINSLVSARLYRNPPSEAQKLDSAGVLGGFEERVTAFSASDTANFIYTVTFAAVSDPDPSSGAAYDLWYLVANVLLAPGQQEQIIWEEVLIWRVAGLFTVLDVDENAVYDEHSDIEDQLGTTKTRSKIARAKEDIFKALKDRGLVRHRIEQTDLRLLTITHAAQKCFASMGPDYRDLFNDYKDDYLNMLAGMKIGYQDGENSATEPTDLVDSMSSLRIRI